MTPTFSIIIPTLNEQKFLPHLLDSLVFQSMKNFDVTVVDGHSKDKTILVAKRFLHTLPLTIVKSDIPGVSLQRNKGAHLSSNEWLVFVDADSVLMPYFIERLTSFISKENPNFFTTWFRPDSDVSGDALLALAGNLFVEGSIIFHRPVAPGPLTIVTRDVFDMVHGYDETLRFGEDYDLTRRIALQGIALQMLRETLYIFSLRRVRNEGKIYVIRLYLKAALLVLFTKKNLRDVPGYITGGHLYGKKRKPMKQSVLRQFESRVTALIKEFFKRVDTQ